jgi:hypothetical protein
MNCTEEVLFFDESANMVLDRSSIFTSVGVYFIQAGDEGPIKIGRALDVDQRRFTLQSAHYETLHLRLVYVPRNCNLLDSVAAVERRFHRVFEEQHLRGEWFSPGGELQEFIENPRRLW